MSTVSPRQGSALELINRHSERGVLDRFVEGVRAGDGGALVLQGEPGVGKTALLDYLVGQAAGCQVERIVGVQSEMELAFAGLHQLCVPLLDHVGVLPAPQRDTLRTAFGMSPGPPADPFLIGLAVLGLLSEAAGDQPLICVIDDQQWLDRASAQALGFVARRLGADPLGLVFAARSPTGDVAGLPELVVAGLAEDDAQALLERVFTGPLDAQVRDQIIAETRGNPLALLELPHGLTVTQLAGGFGLVGGTPLTGRIEESFRRQIEALPDPSRRLVHLAAADPSGNASLVWRAAELLGIPAIAAEPATEAGLVEFGARVRFRHPLVRSAAYQLASVQARQAAHGALAKATDPEADPDRRAWHLAHAAAGADEEVAAELVRSANRAQARGGMAAAAAFLERAALLTPAPHMRALRALEAAQSKHLAGAHGEALALLASADADSLGELRRAQADLLRADIAYARRASDAPRLLLHAAARLEPLDPRLARATYLEALWATNITGRLGKTSVREAAEAARRASRPAQPPTPVDLLLDGISAVIVDGYQAGVPALRQAIAAFRRREVPPAEELRWLWAVADMARRTWDHESYLELSARHVELARQTGVLAGLPSALGARVVVQTIAGELNLADQAIEELRTLTDAMGVPMLWNGPLIVAAWRGREAPATALIDTAMRDVRGRGEGGGLAVADYARAVLLNGLGRYPEALAAASALEPPDVEGHIVLTMGLPELIEAAVRAEAPLRAAEAMRQLAELTLACDTDWAAGVRARSQALLSPDDSAEPLYREAIDRLGRTRVRPELARAHLIYGEWLRRQNRRVDARKQLRTAYGMFSVIGAEAFADRTRHELAATGVTVRKRTVETVTELTPQEAHIAWLAAEGHTNPEIGAQLFLSARTVEWHLRKIFGKLGIGSRRDLLRVLASGAEGSAAT
ncbi:MAG TPA: AAA family ATPase [Trebonia sp.]|jgi:DNA-binding CsgD family transcriptional regulator